MACAAEVRALSQIVRAMGRPLPAACGEGAPTGAPGGSSLPPPTEPHGPTQSPPPTPVPADPGSTAHAASGHLACVMDRDAHRVMIGGTAQGFTVRCSGIPLPGNPTGAGTPAIPPTAAADGRAVRIVWPQPQGGGEVIPLHASASYRAPAHAPNPADVRVSATVTVVGANGQGLESVSVSRLVHVVSRTLHLDVDAHIVDRCSPVQGGTLGVGFDLACHQGIDLRLADDFSVTGSGGTSCGAGQMTGIQPCTPIVTRAVPHPGWSLTGASGQLDPETAILTLQVQGNRVDLPDVTFSNGSTSTAHTVTLFPRPFTVGADDGSTRSFGSLMTTPSAGAVNAFTVHAR